MHKEGEKKTSSLNVRLEPLTKDLLNRLSMVRGSNPSQLAREGILLLLTKEGYLEPTIGEAYMSKR